MSENGDDLASNRDDDDIVVETTREDVRRIIMGNGEDDRYRERQEQEHERQVDDIQLMIQRQLLTAISNQNELMKRTIDSRTFQVMPDLNKSIKTFMGREATHEAKAWINGVDGLGKMHNWPEAVKLETARMNLDGAAKNWYLSKNISSWAQFKAAFERTFIGTKSTLDKWKQMNTRTQQKGEHIMEYFHDKIRLGNDLNLTFREKKEAIIEGLWSKELAQYLMATNEMDEDELLDNVRRFDRINTSRINRITEKRTNTLTTTKPTLTDKPNVKTEPQIEATVTARRSVTCYNCKQEGHLSRDCLQPRRINNYSNQPRTTDREPVIKKEKNAVNMLSDDAICKYLKTVTLDNMYRVGALIDGGSSICTIKKGVVELIKPEVVEANMPLFAFGNVNEPVVNCKGYVSMTLTVDDVSGTVDFWMVDDHAQAVDVIVGRSFMDLAHVAYIKKGNELLFGEASEEPFKDLNIPETNRENENLIVTSIETCIVNRNTINYIQGQVGSETAWVPIVNNGHKDMSVKVGQKLGRIKTLEEADYKASRQPITNEMLNVDPDVTAEEKGELLQLLNVYRDCVCLNIQELGKCDRIKMDIVEKPGSVPVSCKPYRTTEPERKRIKEIVEEWKAAGIIKDTTSPYASPVLLVPKKNGESRLVIDFRRLNAQTQRINYPLPNLDEHLEVLHGNKVFITMDLAHGYLQVPLTDEAMEKTAFITPDDTGQFTRVMFGLTNAPFYFSKLMQTVLGPLKNQTILHYLDDILIPGRSWKELMEKLVVVLEALREAGLTIKLEKCMFGRKQIEYLGFIISEDGLRPNMNKVEAMRKFRRPSDVHAVRRFVGMASFFRRFIPKFATRAEPLTRLIKKDHNFDWGEDQERSFEDLKAALMKEPVLQLYNPKAEVNELHTDASKVGVAAIFFQGDKKNELHPVYAISWRTSDTECNYHSSKLELLAIVWAVERLRNFLIGLKFVIVTDCQALVYLNIHKTKNPQVVRWSNSLSEYDYEIKHRPGIKMMHVDALSREPVDSAIVNSILNLEDELLLYQSRDPELKTKIDLLKNPKNTSNTEKERVRGYKLINGMLYKSASENDQEKHLYVVPKSLRKSLVIKYHDLKGHSGIERVVAKIREHYYFPGLRSYVKRHIKLCIECILSKAVVGPQRGELHPIPPGRRPFEIVHVDHLGPFVATPRKNKFVLVITDNLTKFVRLEAVKDTKAITTVRKMTNFVNDYGAPNRIISDRGTCFTSSDFDNFCKSHGIRHTLNSSRHPQANGAVERVNAVILPMMQIATSEKGDVSWDTTIKKIERDLNSSKNKTTGKTAFELLYGYIPRWEDGQTRYLTTDSETYQDPNQLREEAISKIILEQEKMKKRYDSNRYRNIRYDVGDIVFMKCNKTSTGESTKLQRRYRGPLVISKVLPGDTYGVNDLRGDDGRRTSTTAHVSQLKIWRHQNMDETDSDEENSESAIKTEKVLTERVVRRGDRKKQKPLYLKDYVSGDTVLD